MYVAARVLVSLVLVGSVIGSAGQAQAQDPPAAGARPPTTRANTGYRIPDRVEVNYGGTWYPGSIYAARDGRFKVMRDQYTSDDHWVTVAELRPLAAPARKPPPPPGDQPRTIPAGKYVCASVTAGFSSGNSATSVFGQIHVVGVGSYTAMTREGKGAEAHFAYDPGSRKVTWDGGKMQGFFGKIVESSFGLDNRGIPVIRVVYRAREGGNLFTLDCQREGA